METGGCAVMSVQPELDSMVSKKRSGAVSSSPANPPSLFCVCVWCIHILQDCHICGYTIIHVEYESRVFHPTRPKRL